MQGMQAYLQQMVERSSSTLLDRDGKPSVEGLLFLGNPQLVFPRLLFEDPVLEPVDRNVWAAVKLAAASGDSITAFPSYRELMLRCNVGSKATIARSISILRSTRWLTVCKARLRDANGRVRGNIYALHDEPLQLAETLELDDHYIDWLEGSADGKHTPHRRAIAIADRVLVDIRAQLRAGEDITRLEMPIPRRIQAMESAALTANGENPVGPFFALSAESIMEIADRCYLKAGILVGNTQETLSTVTVPGVPSGEPAENRGNQGGGYSNCTGGVSTVTVPRSSKYLKKEENTTTYPVVTTEVGGSTVTGLTWPTNLTRNDKGVVRLQLGTIPQQHHQPVLDALAAKLSSVANGKSQPFTSNILAYTRKLCELVVVGKLNPVPTIAPIAPTPPDNPDTPPQTPETVDRAVKALACQLSNASAEAKRMKQLAAADSRLAGAALEAEELWKGLSQRYTELKQVQIQMQGRVLH
ncbi:MAG: STY4528 family pathogenicity island replication protein [Thiothrix sp.]|uniref:STY4528 family pathogenicity island replication protein n=1 Tax=Thiothrix sp. TaxID=1032 RepID=UPI00261F01AC|nr:STY4528 family pathogenicity island replication protein [Thiothrix sp.]MDD5394328.1 STY4528 family pathogenicity island replication protein [Thiothrix sp.]